MDKIKITGAREHNLKNIDIEIPRNKLVALVGVSGSGKSTIAFDIIHTEGQRQYFESLNAYARRFLQKSNRPNIDTVTGLSPTIVIDQHVIRDNPRSTVGTITEIYNYLRLLYSRAGTSSLSAGHFSFNSPLGACPKCKGLGRQIGVDINKVIDFNKSLNDGAILHRTWYVGSLYWNIIRATNKFDLDKKIKDYSKTELDLLLYSKPFKVSKSSADALTMSYEGIVNRIIKRNSSSHRVMKNYDKQFFKIQSCDICKGGRLNERALSVKIAGKNIAEVANSPIGGVISFLKEISHPHALPILPRMLDQLEYLKDIGLSYLSLNRSVDTLSGGESQRIKLARQLGSDLIQTIYVLDEPTKGLHPRDVDTLIKNLKKLRDLQNTVIVVEHDPMVIKSADYILEIGPGAGRYGGEIVSSGTMDEIKNNPQSLTGQYLSGKKKVSNRVNRRKSSGYLEIKNANLHNLKNLNVKIPTGVIVAVTGVSGAGKSTLIDEIFVRQYQNKVVVIDQSPIGSTPRGNSATYVGAFDYIRDVFAKESGVGKGLFSSNSRGACPECKGMGYKRIDMQFLGDIKIPCEACEGKKYISEVLKYKFKNKNIYEVLEMTIDEARQFFQDEEILGRLNLLNEVGLGYLQLGQTLDTLSGGEAQRLKLADRLKHKGEFYVLDEPTSGLHFADIERLINLLNRIVDNGNSVLIVEHNIDVIKNADWVIDLGPEGGEEGGYIIAEGTPEEIAKVKKSYTGRYLQTVISG